jgi:hypothetical protein
MTIRTPLFDAAISSAVSSSLLLGTFPDPYVCRPTPLTSDVKKSLTYNVEMNPLFIHSLYISELLDDVHD